MSALARQAADLAGEVLVASRQRMLRLQTDHLRRFEIDILTTQTPDTKAFMRDVLRSARILTDTQSGWGEVALIRRYPGDGEQERRVEKSYAMTFSASDADLDPWYPANVFDIDHPKITHPLFQRVVASKQSAIVLDTQLQPEEQPATLPWPARSLLCVPLLWPKDDEEQSDEVYGLLTLAHPEPCNFNDADNEIISLFAQPITHLLHNIPLLHAR